MSVSPMALTATGVSSRLACTIALPFDACPPRKSTHAVAKTARMIAP